MNRNKASKWIDFRWSILALVAMVSVITLGGTLASSASQPEGSSGMAKIASPGASTGSPAEVKIDNFSFSPGR